MTREEQVIRDFSAEIIQLRAEIERLTAVIKRGRLCDPRYCTFGNETNAP